MKIQIACTYQDYEFPHGFGSGRCDGLSLVVPGSECRDFHLNNNGCEVMKGQKHPRECVYVQEFTQTYEIKL